MKHIYKQEIINIRLNKFHNEIPYTNKQYNIDANVIEKGKVSVQFLKSQQHSKMYLMDWMLKIKNTI